MERIGILATLQAKPGRENDVETFLKSAESLAQAEPRTLRWYALRLDASHFAIFDTFADTEGREAHVAGEIAQRLFASAEELLAEPPSIQFVDVIANKTSAW